MTMRDLSEDEHYEVRKSAWIAFMSSAIAGFKPQKTKYTIESYAEEVADFATAVADRAMQEFLDREKDGFEFEELEEDDEEDDEEEDDDRPRRGRRR